MASTFGQGARFIGEDALPFLGALLGLSAHVRAHLQPILRERTLGQGESVRIDAGAAGEQLLCVTRGAVWIRTAPGATHRVPAVPPAAPFVVESRSFVRVTAQEPSRIIQVDGAALCHLRAWDRQLAGVQEEETRRRMAAIREPLLFAGVPAADLPMLIGSMDVVEVAEGRELVREGERCERLYLLDSGHAEVWKDGAKTGDVEPGDLFPQATLDRCCCDATIRTRSPARLLVLFRADLDALKAWGTRRPAICHL